MPTYRHHQHHHLHPSSFLFIPQYLRSSSVNISHHHPSSSSSLFVRHHLQLSRHHPPSSSLIIPHHRAPSLTISSHLKSSHITSLSFCCLSCLPSLLSFSLPCLSCYFPISLFHSSLQPLLCLSFNFCSLSRFFVSLLSPAHISHLSGLAPASSSFLPHFFVLFSVLPLFLPPLSALLALLWGT